MLQLSDVIELSEQEIKYIQGEILSLSAARSDSLKPVFEALNEQYSYDILRCVKAGI